MAQKKDKSPKDSYPDAETERRLRQTLVGAFNGPPTHLKDIPKKNGERRHVTKSRHISRASAKT